MSKLSILLSALLTFSFAVVAGGAEPTTLPTQREFIAETVSQVRSFIDTALEEPLSEEQRSRLQVAFASFKGELEEMKGEDLTVALGPVRKKRGEIFVHVKQIVGDKIYLSIAKRHDLRIQQLMGPKSETDLRLDALEIAIRQLHLVASTEKTCLDKLLAIRVEFWRNTENRLLNVITLDQYKQQHSELVKRLGSQFDADLTAEQQDRMWSFASDEYKRIRSNPTTRPER